MILLVEEHWIWQGVLSHGYGVITYPTKRFPHLKIGRRKDHRPGWRAIMTHQLFYYMKYGNPPLDTELGHTCSRRSCCNPDHVRPITRQQNAWEMYQMPHLSRDEREAIEEAIIDDQPLGQIADFYQISVWSVRKIASEIVWRDQFHLPLEDVPF